MAWINIEQRGPVRWFVLSNPGRKNAVPSTGWSELATSLEDFEGSDARVLVIRGEGGDFCAGADLQPTSMGLEGVVGRQARMKTIASAAIALHRSTKPTIAAVDGVAVGAGMNLALGCDVVVASDRVRFSEIFVRRGLTLDFGGTWLLPRVVGIQRAKELALSGRMVEAEEALRIGLCLEVVRADRLEEAATDLAERFLEGAPLAQRFAKQAIDSTGNLSFEDALDWEGQSQSICFSTADVTEGIAAFGEKRSPRFQGH